MANQQANLSIGGKVLALTLIDQNDGSYAIEHVADLRGWDATALASSKLLVDHATGALLVTSAGGGGGGGPVTIADGGDVAQGATTDTSAANTVVGILKAIKAAITGTLAVSGTFWQATQPVSLATNTPDVTDRAARLVGHVTVDSAPTTPVTGTFFQATQPVSLATNTPDVTDRAARLLGHVTVDSAPTTAITAAALPLPAGAASAANQPTLKAASTIAAATDTASVVQHSPQRADAANLCVTVTAATGVAATLSIPAAGAGLFHYISLIEIQLYATAARTGGATPVLVTTTNLPGSPAWDFDTAQAIGTTIRQATQPATPIKSSAANTATTIVAPIATTGIWRITAYYYAAP